MDHTYFISYHYKRDEETFGFGMVEIAWPKKIGSFAELKQIADEITRHDGTKSSVILNFQLLGTEP